MADPLSITASIIAIIQLTTKVVSYLQDVKHAPRECQQCAIEASNLLSLLINLRYHLESATKEDPWFTAVTALNVENGPFDQYRQALEELSCKVRIQEELEKIKRRVVWTLNKGEVERILQRMERLKGLVSIALELDHLYV